VTDTCLGKPYPVTDKGPVWPPVRMSDLVPGTAVPIVIVLYMLKFSTGYPDRVSQASN